MTQSEKQSWEKARARGHRSFILREGLLRWGVPFGAFMALGQWLWAICTHVLAPPFWELGSNFVFFTMAFGYLTGEGRWRKCERDYAQPSEDEHTA